MNSLTQVGCSTEEEREKEKIIIKKKRQDNLPHLYGLFFHTPTNQIKISSCLCSYQWILINVHHYLISFGAAFLVDLKNNCHIEIC